MSLALALKQFGGESALQKFAVQVTDEFGPDVVGETSSYISWKSEKDIIIAIYFKKKSACFSLAAEDAKAYVSANGWTDIHEMNKKDPATLHVHVISDALLY